MARFRFPPEFLDCSPHIPVQAKGRIFGKIIEKRRRFFEKEGKVIFYSGRRETVADILVEACFRRVALEFLPEVAAKPAPSLFVHGEFAGGKQLDFLYRIDAALGIDVECSDIVDFVVEKIDPVGKGAAHGKEIDQSASEAVFARTHDLAHVRVARDVELMPQLVRIDARLLFEKESVGCEEFDGRKLVKRGACRYDNDIQTPLHDPVQGGKALRDQVLMRREIVVGQGFPVGEKACFEFGAKIADFVEKALCVQRLFRDDDEWFGFCGDSRKQERVARPARGGIFGFNGWWHVWLWIFASERQSTHKLVYYKIFCSLAYRPWISTPSSCFSA